MSRVEIRRTRVASRVGAGLLTAAAIAAVPQAAAAASARDAALTRSIRRALATTAAPGAIVGVWQHGRAPYVRSFGVRDTATRRPMRRDLHMRIGSVTKTFTVTALLQLVDQGKVRLDDPIAKYVPGVVSGETISLRQLAEMRSGLVNYSATAAFDRLLTDEPLRPWTPPELLSYAVREPLLFAPGKGFSYSNTNTILLGLVVEQVSGERLGAYIRRHVTAPLGMRQTSFPAGTRFPAPHAQGYANTTPDGRIANATGWDPTWTWAAGQMVSTLRDLRTWAPRLVSGRGLLSARTQRLRIASVTGDGPIVYGIGMFNVRGWLGHNGSLPGFQTLSLHHRRTRTTVVALINSDVARRGVAPSTVIGEAITRVISPRNVYSLPASPVAETAVVGGTPASRSAFPAFSVVGRGCGGTLIAPDRVLTAAHCTTALEESDQVLVGPRNERRTIRLRAILPLHVRELAKMEREFPPPAGDLMILQLDRPVTGVPVAEIATAADGFAAPGSTVTTIGRGAASSDGRGQGVFRSALVDLVAPGSCRDQLPTALLRRWSLCTQGRPVPGPSGRRDRTSACVGDSGGPLLAGTGTAARIVGVVSWGPMCGEDGDPEIYANAVAGRAFALAPRPAWAPAVIGRARIAGTAAVGSTVTCAVRWLVRPTRRLDYSFTIDGYQKQEGRRPTFRLTSEHRGGSVSCSASGETIGGRGGSPGLARARVVR